MDVLSELRVSHFATLAEWQREHAKMSLRVRTYPDSGSGSVLQQLCDLNACVCFGFEHGLRSVCLRDHEAFLESCYVKFKAMQQELYSESERTKSVTQSADQRASELLHEMKGHPILEKGDNGRPLKRHRVLERLPHLPFTVCSTGEAYHHYEIQHKQVRTHVNELEAKLAAHDEAYAALRAERDSLRADRDECLERYKADIIVIEAAFASNEARVAAHVAKAAEEDRDLRKAGAPRLRVAEVDALQALLTEAYELFGTVDIDDNGDFGLASAVRAASFYENEHTTEKDIHGAHRAITKTLKCAKRSATVVQIAHFYEVTQLIGILTKYKKFTKFRHLMACLAVRECCPSFKSMCSLRNHLRSIGKDLDINVAAAVLGLASKKQRLRYLRMAKKLPCRYECKRRRGGTCAKDSVKGKLYCSTHLHVVKNLKKSLV